MTDAPGSLRPAALVHLAPGREKSLLRRHPWVFSGAVARVDGSPARGDTVEVRSASGAPLGRGAYSPASQIAVRMWTFDPAEEVGPALFRARLGSAVALRRTLLDDPLRTACRLVHGESDGLPGFLADRYGEWIVCQFLSAGAERWRDELAAELVALQPAAGIWERSDAEVRSKEGLALRTGALASGARLAGESGHTGAGGAAAAEPPELVPVREGPYRLLADLRRGHKTGLYLDQAANRLRLMELASGAEVLNVFAYAGAFSVAALTGGAAKVSEVESSAPALELGRRTLELNGIDPQRVEQVEGDAFQVLRRLRDARRAFDIAVLDPPKFAESQRQVPGAARGYKDINLLACKLLRPGGLLLTFSCSGAIGHDLFQKIVADAALDAGRFGRIVEHLGAGSDHPVALPFPEGTYLKGLAVRVD